MVFTLNCSSFVPRDPATAEQVYFGVHPRATIDTAAIKRVHTDCFGAAAAWFLIPLPSTRRLILAPVGFSCCSICRHAAVDWYPIKRGDTRTYVDRCVRPPMRGKNNKNKKANVRRYSGNILQ